MSRVIRYFDGLTEEFAGEYDVGDISLDELQELFGVGNTNPMYDSFPVDNKVADYFRGKLNLQFDFEKYDYFLEYS